MANIKVKDNYELVNELLSKNNGMYLPPDTYNKYARLASDGYYNTLVGLDNRSTVHYGLNRKLDSRLRVFRRNESFTVVYGEVDLSAIDGVIGIIRSIHYVLKGKIIPIRPVDEDRFATLFDDPFAEPIKEAPFYTEEEDSIMVYPKDIETLNIRYLKRPSPVKYNYTVANRRAIYSPIGSVDFEWGEDQEAEITMRILQYAGVSMSNADIVQYTQQKLTEE